MTSAVDFRWTLRFAAAWVFVLALAFARAEVPGAVPPRAPENDASRGLGAGVPPIVPPSTTGGRKWMAYLGGSDWDDGGDIAVDDTGNALVTGSTNSSDFHGRNNSRHASAEAYVASVAPSGALHWMTYLGGSSPDSGYGIAVDGDGNALVTGVTSSDDFEGRKNAYHGGDGDAFVAKTSSTGRILWMTYLGGSAREDGIGIAVDQAGNAFVAGVTSSTDLEKRTNAYHGGDDDVFVAKVSPSGALLWVTYMGGSGGEIGISIAVDGAGKALVTGWTHSTDFEGRNNDLHGDADAFVAKVNASGALEWMTYLGGGDGDFAGGVDVDAAGNALVGGQTFSVDFEGSNNSFRGGTEDGFAAKISPSGTLQWVTYIGGWTHDSATGIAVNDAGVALLTGWTRSSNLEGRTNEEHGHSYDAFIAKVSSSGLIRWSTYLGGNGSDSGTGVAVDGAGNALVAGITDSIDFDWRNNAYHGRGDVFVVKLPFAAQPRCTGRERIAKAKCVEKNGANRLKVTLVRGAPGDEFTVTLSTGDEKAGTINRHGKGKARFKHLPPGPGTATARWDCGAESPKEYGCP